MVEVEKWADRIGYQLSYAIEYKVSLDYNTLIIISINSFIYLLIYLFILMKIKSISIFLT